MKQRSNWWLLCGRTEPCVSFVTGAEILPCYSESSLYTACSTRYASTARGTRCRMLRPWRMRFRISLDDISMAGIVTSSIRQPVTVV